MKALQNEISRAFMRITAHPVAASDPKWDPELIPEKKFPHGHFLSLQRTLTHNLDGLALCVQHTHVLSVQSSLCVCLFASRPFALFMPTHQNIRSKFNISTMSWPGNVGSLGRVTLFDPLAATRASTRDSLTTKQKAFLCEFYSQQGTTLPLLPNTG